MFPFPASLAFLCRLTSVESPGSGRLEELEMALAVLDVRWTASGITAAVADADGPAFGIESFMREGPAIG